MLHRVFAGCLPSTKHWYALNNEICSVLPQRFCESKVFELFPEEIRSLPLDDLHGENGAKVPAHIFNGGKSKIHVFVGTTFAILIACLRRKDPGNADLLKDANFTQIISQIDSMNLEDLLTRQKRPQFPETPPQTPPTTPPSSSPYSLFPPSTFENCSPEVKKRKIRERLFGLYNLIEIVATENGESLSTVVSKCCLLEKERRIKASEKPSSMIQEVISTVCSEKGLAQGFDQLIASETWESFVQTQKVPDWQLLLCKLETLLSDDGWQKVLNRTNIGFSGVSFHTTLHFFTLLCVYFSSNMGTLKFPTPFGSFPIRPHIYVQTIHLNN